ncbi:MAG: sialate O-acetylesterase, partial [Verrucomicrobiota bacterium]
MKKILLLLTFCLGLVSTLRAEIKLPAIFSDHMVLQQKQSNPIWGWDTPGTKVTVAFAGQTKSATAGKDGRWEVKLDPVNANATPQVISIAGTTKRDLQDVLVGEVWMCSGQSNMGFQLNSDWNGDIEAAASDLPNLRLIKVPTVGTQEPQTDFKGEWKASNAESARGFSAVGFFYGRYLHNILHVPVGLIDNAWGGSAAEAWVRRSSLEGDVRFKQLMEDTVKREALFATTKAADDHEKAMAKWKQDVEKMKAAGLKPGQQLPRQPRSPQDWLKGNARPGNIFNGELLPTL